MDSSTIAMIGTAVLGALAFFGVLALVLKYTKVLKEIGDVLVVVVDAIQDAKVTSDEVDAVKREIQEVKAAFAGLKSK